jgi:Lon protease-like protein
MLPDLPLFPLNIVLLPGELQPLHIFEPRYRELTARCERTGEPFAIVLADAQGLRRVACTCLIAQVLERFRDGRSNILVRGERPVELVELHDHRAYRTATARQLVDEVDEAPREAQEAAIASYEAIAAENEVGRAPEAPAPGPGLSYALAGRVDLGSDVKQRLLQDRDEVRRLAAVTELLEELTRGLRIAAEVQRQARANGRVRTPEEIARFLEL